MASSSESKVVVIANFATFGSCCSCGAIT